MNPIHRRQFLLASGALLVAPLAVAQQAGRTYRVGVMLSGNERDMRPFLQALRDRLAMNGFVEGRNLQLAIRPTVFDHSIDLETARAIVATGPDAIFSFTSRNTKICQEVAGHVPVIFTFVGDAVAFGLVKDFSRPGGNSTGASWRQFELTAKRLELVRELLPRAKRIVFAGYLFDVSFHAIEKQLRQAAAGLGFELIDANGAPRLDEAASHAMRNGADAVFVYQPILMLGQLDIAKRIIGAATERRIPVFFPEAELVALGGLLAYGPSLADEVRRSADQLARVLRGAKPSDLPVELADRFELVVNLRIAKALGITVPQSVLVRADRVIE